MEIRITISSLGAGLPGTGFGLNIISAAYVEVRASKNSNVRLFGVTDYLSLGNNSVTIGAGHAQTAWMKVNSANLSLLALSKMQSSRAEINIVGTLLGTGTIDVKFELINKAGESSTVLDLKGVKVPTPGAQISSTKVRGEIKLVNIHKAA